MSKVPKINRRTFSKIVGLGVGYAIVLATFFSHPAQAQSAAISKGRAVEIAREKFGGKPFGKIKELENSNGSVTYEVRLDNGGRVLIVHVDEQGNARKQ